MMLVTLFGVTVFGQKGMKLQPITKLHQNTLLVKGFDRKAQSANSKVTRRAPGDELVTPPSSAILETWYTASGKFYIWNSSSRKYVDNTSEMATVNVAIDGTDLYIQGLAYWFKESWIKGTISGYTVTFANSQFVGSDDYGVEYLSGSDDGETLSESIVFEYDATEGVLAATTPYIFENSSKTEMQPFTFWNLPVFTKAEPAGPQVVVPPTGLIAEEYSMVYTPYGGEELSGSASINVGFDGNDVYFQGFCSYLPEAWIKGTLADGVVTFAGNQYFGEFGGTYDIFFQDEDAVFEYEAATNTFYTEGLVYTYTGNQYVDYYMNPTLSKVEEQAATPETPAVESLDDGNYGWYISFNIPTVDTDGNGLVTSKLAYQFFVKIDGIIYPLTFTPETHQKLTEPMTIFPYGFTENYDFYSNQIYFNDLFSYDWDQIGIQSIYTGGDEENKSEIAWFTIPKPVVAPEGLETETYNFSALAVEAGHEDGGPQPYANQVQVGFDGNDAYIQGLVADAPELWVKATKNGAGQYVIPSNQYMGKLSIMGYVFPYYWTAVDAEDNMVDAVFSFDAENSRFTTAQTQVLNGAEDKLEPYITFTEVVIEKMVEVAATPADPTMEKVVFDVKNAPGNNSLNCSLAIVGTNDEVLNTSKLFYTIWIEKDGEQKPYVFTAALYTKDFEEDVVEIPYSHDGYDIYKGGEIIYLEDDIEELQTWTKVGIQSIYYGAGECHKSNIIWQDNPVATGISALTTDKLQKREGAWYTIGGQRVVKPTQKGLYIHNGKKVVIK